MFEFEFRTTAVQTYGGAIPNKVAAKSRNLNFGKSLRYLLIFHCGIYFLC